MANKKPKFVCLSCHTIFNKKPGITQTCWKCQSTKTQRLTAMTTTPLVAPTVSSQTTPTVTTSSIPAPPSAPPPVPSRSTATSGGGITPELLQAQRLRLRAVPVQEAKPLPGPTNSATPLGVRVLANQVANGDITGVRYGLSYRPRGSSKETLLYTSSRTKKLGAVLANIAAGMQNSAHGNFNSRYRNHGLDLPSRTGPQGVVGVSTAFKEYGWNTSLAENTQWFEKVSGAFVRVSNNMERAVNQLVKRAFGGSLNSERLVISETGEVFYTPDHYVTFYRYHPGTAAWYEYCSEERFSGRGPHWDESFYG